MAEQNMWKKQMLANKNKAAETKPEPPKPAETNNAPPWAKNNQSTAPSWANKNTESTGNQPPWMKNNSNNQNTTNQPPWAKNNTNTDTATNSQPSWAKNNANPPVTNNPPSTGTAPNPPWMKQNQQATTNSPAIVKPSANLGQNSPANQPPWMKNNPSPAQESSPSPPWANKNAGSSSSPQPSWANKAPSTPGGTNNPPWMKGQSSGVGQNNNVLRAQKMADMQKQKKEMEEKQRLLQEEEKERKRQERIKREKQEEEANLMREIQCMEREDEQSKQRQAGEKEERERVERERIEREQRQKKERQQQQRKQREQRERKEQQQRLTAQRLRQQAQQRQRQKEQQGIRLQNQRTRLENQRLQLQRLQKSKSRSGKKSRRGLQSSKISHVSSIRGGTSLPSSTSPNPFQAPPLDPSLPENLFHKYIRLLNQESSQGDYREKIALQAAVIQLQLQFKRDCQAQIAELLSKKKVTNRKRKVVFSNSMQVRYGLTQGRRGQGRTEFSQAEGQKLVNLFLYYQAITKCIVGLMKRKVSIHFRVPLLNLATHKGITFLMEYLCPQLLEINETDISLFQEVSNELLVLQRQLELAYDGRNDYLKPLTRNQLMVKKVSIYREDYYVLYIKEDALDAKTTSPAKSHQQPTPLPALNYLKLIQYVSGENNMLPFYSPPLLLPNIRLNDISEKTAPPGCKQLMCEIALANAINLVYSSCQGEVQQGIFFDLILNQNKEVWQMIKSAGFPQAQQPSAVALAYLQRIAALRFAFTDSFFTGKRKSPIETVQPAVFIQKHEFQMLEFVKNVEKYIAEGKQDLVEESMRMNRQLWEEIEKGSRSAGEGVSVLKAKREVAYLLFKGKEEDALQLLQATQSKLPPFAIQNIPLSLLFLKIHIKADSQMPLLKKLSQLLQLLQFYFKQETIIHSYVYTIVGNYYSTKASDPDRQGKVITFFAHAINIAVRLYGEKAQEVAEVYLSRAKAMLALGKNDSFQKDMATAGKIYKSHSKNNAKIAECNYLLGRVACQEGRTEGVELMESSSALFLKMGNYVQSLRVGFELLPFLQGDQHKYEMQIERIVEICFRHKSVWAFQRVTTLLLERELHCYTSLTIESLLQACAAQAEQGPRSKEEVMIDLQEEIKGFTSFIEIVRWSLSILAAKTLIRKQSSSDYWKALAILRDVIDFYQHQKPHPEQSPPA